MDALSRSALGFFNRAARAASLDELIKSFGDVGEAASCAAAGCFHIARPGQPIAPRPLFSWNLSRKAGVKLSRLLSRQTPALQAFFMSSTPVALSELAADQASTSCNGLLIPIHGPLGEIMCIAILRASAAPFDRQARMTLQTAAILLANRGTVLVEIESEPSQPGTSPREAQCAFWAAKGKTDWEIGHILNLHEDTVAFYLDRLKAKVRLGERARVGAGVWREGEDEDD